MIFWVGAITLAADKGKWEYEGDARGKTAGESASATHRKHQHRPLGKYVLLRQWRENLISESTFAVATVHCVHYARFTRSSSLLHETRSDPVRVSTDARHSSPLRCPVSFLLPTICRSKYLESSITRLCYRAFRGLSCARRNSFFFDGNSFIVGKKYRADGRFWLEITESLRYSRYRWCVRDLPYLKKGNCCVSCNSITGDSARDSTYIFANLAWRFERNVGAQLL